MKRREFITLVGGAAVAWPLTARAQQPAMPVVGFINSASPGQPYPPLSAFLKGLSETGFVEGRNVAIEYRWAEGHYERLPALIANLVQSKVNVIAATSTPASVAAKAADITKIPIVFTTGGNPVQLGFVNSLGKPGGNFTGATTLNEEVLPKRLELMHEVLPAIINVALLVNPRDPLAEQVSRDMTSIAAALRLELHVVRASREQDLAAVFESLAQLRVGALVISTAAFFNSFGKELGELSLRYRVPAIYQHRQFAAAGGLMSYGGDLAESYRVVGEYVGRILKGEKPADLPVTRSH